MTVDEWLIDAIRIRPIIWNTKDENYKNIKMKNEAYEEIAQERNLSVQEIKKKWHSIRSAFSRELRMRSLCSSVGPNQKREWKHFNKLIFLQDECRLELDGQIEDEFTVSFVTEDDASSSTTLYNLPTNEINNSSPIENGESNNRSSNAQITNVKQNTSNKKRKSQVFNAFDTSNSFKSTPVQNHGNSFAKFHSVHQSVNPLSEEEIFGHSIAASLRKFDDKKKEIVKLKLQEVIVNYLNNDQ